MDIEVRFLQNGLSVDMFQHQYQHLDAAFSRDR